jgi:2-oxoisovalerate dehydrogenase E1 component
MKDVINKIKPFPAVMSKADFYSVAYPMMYCTRRLEEMFIDLFAKGKVKGTVTSSIGNEATAVAMMLPFRHGHDVVSLLQRDLGSHLVAQGDPYTIICQYMANRESPTHGREGNVHHGDAAQRRFPMISHLGNMVSTVVGGVWYARTHNKEDIYGLSVSGDGGTSTGDFHESLNIASVRRVPVLFCIENNHYAFSTPVSYQYRCEKLSDRAQGYGIGGTTIDGTDAWEVYTTVVEALQRMQKDSLPFLLECMTLRLKGHAVYDKAEYVSAQQLSQWQQKDPLPRARRECAEHTGMSEEDITAMENDIGVRLEAHIEQALRIPPPSVTTPAWDVYAPQTQARIPVSRQLHGAKFLQAINTALGDLLSHEDNSFLIGQDIGPYGSAFKTCKGLHEKFGDTRVLDMPICEAATTGFCLGASQTGGRAVMEYQFADFATEATTQIGLNMASWYFRAHKSVPVLLRMPCGGGITLGAFHSGEYEGLWSVFPGLKLVYPFTAQEAYEAIVAGFYDPNPCMVFEHKLLYWSQSGDVTFDGDIAGVWQPRCYHRGTDCTVVTWGAMARYACEVAREGGFSLDVWNPFVLAPLHIEPIVESVQRTGRLLVFHEDQMTRGLGNRIISLITRRAFGALRCAPVLVGAPDTPVPFAPDLERHYLPNKEKLTKAIQSLVKDQSS